jgi:hypothetical protein
MTAVTSLTEVVSAKKREGQEAIIAELKYLMGKAKAGEISGLCYSVVTNKACHSGYVKVPGCGMHELVGGAAMLSDYLLRQTLE